MPRIEPPADHYLTRLQGLHLFHCDPTPCSQRVRFALAEKGIKRGKEVPWNSAASQHGVAEAGKWTSRQVSLIKKHHLSEAYAAIQPNLVVPALVHDGRLYVESMDIVKYIDDAWPHPRLLPRDPEAAAAADELVAQGKALHLSVRYVSFRWGLGRLGKLGRREEDAIRRLEHKDSPEELLSFYSRYNRGGIAENTYIFHLRALEGAYSAIDRLLELDGRPFLTGDNFSIADIIWSCKVLRISECGYPFRRNFPALNEWYARISQRPAFKSGVLYNHRAMSAAFKVKATVENVMGRGLKQASESAFTELR